MKKLTKLQKTSRARAKLVRQLFHEIDGLRFELGRLHALNEIHRTWTDLNRRLFPSQCNCKAVNGIDLLMIDADVAGCISTFLRHGTLDGERVEILQFSRKRLNQVIAGLDGHPRFYFRRLKQVASAVLDYVDDYTPK
jgi:hypothetical protein